MERAESRAPLGVLLTNLGTPASPTPADVRRFLDEFLSDPAVVDWPRWLWLPLLRGIILPRRAQRSARAYASIWSARGSPLLAGTLALRDALATELGATVRVAVGMRYGSPSLETGLAELAQQGAQQVLAVPLYPQYSATTTGTTLAKLKELERAGRLGPGWSALGSLCTDPGYIAALAERTRASCPAEPPEHYLFSFHGLPERYARAGDPYADECTRTATALARALGLESGHWTLSYQSRFGPERWLGPATREVALTLARRGARVAIVMPGFAADCLETLEEIGLVLAREFTEAGGQQLTVVPALNDHPRWVAALAENIRRAIASE